MEFQASNVQRAMLESPQGEIPNLRNESRGEAVMPPKEPIALGNNPWEITETAPR